MSDIIIGVVGRGSASFKKPDTSISEEFTMHHELKVLIAHLPQLIIAEFNLLAVPHDTEAPFPLTVPALFSIVRAECMAQAGVYANVLENMAYAKDVIDAKYKLYRRGENQSPSKLLLTAVRSVLVKIDSELQVALSALLLKVRSESDMIKLLGTHYSNNMDQDLPPYVQYAMDWHRAWCVSPLPAEAQNNYPYPHTEVPVLVFMRHIVAAASGRSTNRAELPWTDEVEKVVYSKLEWLSPTETELLRIGTSRLDSRDVDNDFLKYFL